MKTIKQGARRELIIRGKSGNDANFKRILPGQMAQLVDAGLFEPWEGTYRITAKGREKLKQLERKQ